MLGRDLAQQIRVGCSGWQYKHWRAGFYPAGLPVSRWFAHYAVEFDTVEINNSFYRLPPPETFARWRDQAPRRFLYAVKASRFLTHMKKLKDPEDPLTRFFEGARELGPHLGPVLYQLPPGWTMDVDRLSHFLRVLPEGVRHTVEFRDPSWYDDRVFDLLHGHGVALCLHDMQGSATPKLAVGPFVYVRFHGWTKYAGRYEDERLDEWADWLVERIADGRDVLRTSTMTSAATPRATPSGCATACTSASTPWRTAQPAGCRNIRDASGVSCCR